VRDVPAPPCPRGGVLVRNLFSVISSGTERATVELTQKSLLAKARARPDLVRQVIDTARREGIVQTRETVQRKLREEAPIGYSSAGVVIEVGAGVAGIVPGDVVACAGGEHANHAEVVAIPANLCAVVPAGVEPRHAAFATIAAIAMHGVRLGGVQLGDRVAVVGCGLVGLLTCRLLRAAGAEVYAMDIDPVRLEQARASGATYAYKRGSQTAKNVVTDAAGVGVDAVLVTAAASTNDPLLLAAEIARDRGTVVLVGAVPIEFPRDPLYHKELTFRVSRSYGPGRYDPEYEERGLDYPIGFVRWTEKRNVECFLGLLRDGAVTIDDLVDEVVPVAEAARAYARLTGEPEDRPRRALVLAYPDTTAAEAEATVAAHPVSTSSRGEAGTTPRIGLVGPGNFALKMIVPAFAAAGAKLEAVGGGSGPSAAAAARDHGFSRVAGSADALIADGAVDVVAICTRHADHAELSARALRLGKHVFCEKPLALTKQELDDVMRVARSVDALLMVGFNRRFSPFLAEARAFLAEAGSPVTATYRVSAGRLEREHWTHDLTQGGGRILGEVCHFVDALAFLAGAPVASVHAAAQVDGDVPIQAADNVVVTLTFRNASVGTIVYSAHGAAKVGKERVEAFAGARTIILDDYLDLSLHASGVRPVARKARTQDKGHREEVKRFVDAVSGGGPSPISLDELESSSAATMAIVESLRTGAPIIVGSSGGALFSG
jgi:predicted dehydrogenase